MPHLPGGSVSPEIGKHPGEPVIDLVQGQLPVGGFQNGLWARKQQRPLVWASKGPRLVLSPPGSLSRLDAHAPRAEEARGRSPWRGLEMLAGPEQSRLATAQPQKEHKPRGLCTSVRGTAISLEGKWLQGPLPRRGSNAAFLGELSRAWGLFRIYPDFGKGHPLRWVCVCVCV